MVTRLVSAALFLPLLIGFGGVPAHAADAAHGATVAKRWCASCHVVASEQRTAVADAPSFADVARRRADDHALADFLADPHPKMPDMHLSRGEIADIVAYIRSLAVKPRTAPEPAGKPPERAKNG
jgi:mono/diheme cytochrome c family protein